MKSLGGCPGRPPGLDGGHDIDIVTKIIGKEDAASSVVRRLTLFVGFMATIREVILFGCFFAKEEVFWCVSCMHADIF